MKSATSTVGRRPRTAADGPYFVYHPSFEEGGAEEAHAAVRAEGRWDKEHMADEVTRACARAMHYAGWRISRSRTAAERRRWQRSYLAHRDLVVMGNHKLIYRAVGRWMPPSQWADDMVGDCQIVLI